MTESSIAYNHLESTAREVQTWGWAFNVEHGFPLHPDGEGYINLPGNQLDIDLGTNDLIVRGTRVYDRRAHTCIFTRTLSADVTFFLDWLDIPEVARRFIFTRAARRFQQGLVASQVLREFTAADESQAYARLKQYETRNGNYNLQNNPEFAALNDRRPREFSLF